MVEAVKTEEVKTEPVKTESVKTEPVKTEEVKTEAVKTEPVKTEPAPIKLELPKDSQLSQARLDKIAADAKAQGLSQEAAQARVNTEDEAVKEFAAQMDLNQKQQLTEATERWKQEAIKDPRIGGDALGKNIELSKRVATKHGSEKFQQLLDQTGFNNHPEVVAFMVSIGKLTGEDKIIQPGNQRSTDLKPNAEVFFAETAAQN